MTLSPTVTRALADPNARRIDQAAVREALASLGVALPADFVELYLTYRGSFFSEALGRVLLDVVDDHETVLTQTAACREVHGFPDNFIAISEYSANALLVLDATRDVVFDVSFEGGVEAMLEGREEPRWKSFREFLEEFFGEKEGSADQGSRG